MTELIAAEQAAAAEAKRRREEQQRLEAERKAKAEREAQERRVAEEKRLAEEQKAREKREAEEAARKKETAQKEQSSKKETTKKEAPKKETKKKETPKQNSGKSRDNRSYAEARGRSARSSGSAPAKSQTSTSTSAASASGFASMKGKLPRPVAGSFSVINAFGRHPLPDLPDVMYDNPGIDALVKKGEKAKAVYDGTVSGVYMINGFSNVVLVSHGDYFTVYGNIASPSVSKGQSVKQGQALGTLATDPDDGNRTTIHFEVWKGRTKLNPAEWIR